jgi:hypothetical protein
MIPAQALNLRVPLRVETRPNFKIQRIRILPKPNILKFVKIVINSIINLGTAKIGQAKTDEIQKSIFCNLNYSRNFFFARE